MRLATLAIVIFSLAAGDHITRPNLEPLPVPAA